MTPKWHFQARPLHLTPDTNCLLNNSIGCLIYVSNLHPKSNSWSPICVLFLHFKRHISLQLLKSKTFYSQFPIHWQILLATTNTNLVFIPPDFSTFSLTTRSKFFTQQPKWSFLDINHIMSYLCSNPISIFPSHAAYFRPPTGPTRLGLLLDLCSHSPLVFFLLISSHSLAFLPFLKPAGYYIALLYLYSKCSLLELSSQISMKLTCLNFLMLLFKWHLYWGTYIICLYSTACQPSHFFV